MKIKKILQKIFKNFFRLVFKKIYGQPKLLDNISKLDISKHHIENIEINKQQFKVDKKIYEIDNAVIFTDLVEHVAIIKDNFLVPEISYQQINGELKNVNYNKVLFNGTNRLKKKIKGSILSLVQGASGNNYFHFLFDIIPKIILLEKKDYLKKIDFFFLPDVQNWQITILSKFGISKNQLINSKNFRHLEAEKVIALDHMWYSKGFVQEEIKNIPNWIIFALREKFLNNSKKFNSSERVYIDRSDSLFSHCKLINNNEVKEFLSKHNFKSYQISKLNFFEQIYLFNNAKIIIGPHGAAFSNIIFSKRGLKLYEIIPKNHKSIKCKKISNLLNFDYNRIELNLIKNQTKNKKGDMEISILYLEKILLSGL